MVTEGLFMDHNPSAGPSRVRFSWNAMRQPEETQRNKRMEDFQKCFTALLGIYVRFQLQC